MDIKEIKDWLSLMNIANYVINEDLSVDVEGDVDISGKCLSKIAVKFGKVSGHFYCDNNKLTSLEHFPGTVGDWCSCSNNKLTNLEHCPSHIGQWFDCSNNYLTSLEHCPSHIGGDFYCNYNQLASLEHCPSHVGGLFIIDDKKLKCSAHVANWLIQKDKALFKIIKHPTEEQKILHKMLWLL